MKRNPDEIPDNPERPTIDPSPEVMRQLGYEMIDRMVDHWTTLPEQRVARRGDYTDFMSLVDEPIPQEGTGIRDCFSFFFDRVVPDMTKVNHPRFHAYIPGPSSFAGALGDMLAAITNPFVGSWLGGATVSALELTVLRWIGEMLQVEPLQAGIFTSGGSMANLIGLASARSKYGREVQDKGVLYVSEEGHGSMDKAALILGFSKESIQRIPVDEHFRIQVEELAQLIAQDKQAGRIPFFVSANAGTTNTGAIDPLDDIASLCKQEGLWFHIDAAYGGFAALVPEVRQKMKGLERADSLTLDPHKWLYCPIGVGCALVRDTNALEAAFATEGRYLKDVPVDEVNFFHRGPELTRPARVLAVWMVLRSIGQKAVTQQIAEDIRLAHLAANLLQEEPRLEVLTPSLSVVTFRVRSQPNESEPDRATRDTALMEATLEEGQLMLSSTTLHGKSTLRLVVLNHRTTEADVRHSVERIRALLA